MLESLLNRNVIKKESTPTEPGTPWQGGYYAGRINVDGDIYGIVVSPKAQGETYTSINTDNISVPGVPSLYDGWKNTLVMMTEGQGTHPAAAFCRGLNINGFKDWYLPALDELEICYRYLKPTTEENYTTLVSGRPSGINDYSIPSGSAYTLTEPGQTKSIIFKNTGSEAFNLDFHWTSSQFGPGSTSQRVQRFSDGGQSFVNKRSLYYLRAVRRVLIE